MYLEERKLVHRDLAARNVLVGDKISGVPVVKVYTANFIQLFFLDSYAYLIGIILYWYFSF